MAYIVSSSVLLPPPDKYMVVILKNGDHDPFKSSHAHAEIYQVIIKINHTSIWGVI